MMLNSSFFIAENKENDDIFAYFREKFDSEDLNEDGIVLIDESGVTITGTSHTDVSILLTASDGKKRWVSEDEENQYFTIDFLDNKIGLLAYSIKTTENYRYILSWDLIGIKNNKEYLIDRHTNTPTCKGTGNKGDLLCSSTTTTVFKCQSPGTFSKFKFLHTGLDSRNDNYLSMTRIYFYGYINPKIFCRTFLNQQKTTFFFFLIIILG